MGYMTRFRLSLDGDDVTQEIIADLRKGSDYASYALSSDGSTQDETKWYGHKDDLKEFSKKYPTVLFCLHGEGEEAGDIWDQYFLNGKVQVCKAEIVIPPFDVGKLK